MTSCAFQPSSGTALVKSNELNHNTLALPLAGRGRAGSVIIQQANKIAHIRPRSASTSTGLSALQGVNFKDAFVALKLAIATAQAGPLPVRPRSPALLLPHIPDSLVPLALLLTTQVSELACPVKPTLKVIDLPSVSVVAQVPTSPSAASTASEPALATPTDDNSTSGADVDNKDGFFLANHSTRAVRDLEAQLPDPFDLSVEEATVQTATIATVVEARSVVPTSNVSVAHKVVVPTHTAANVKVDVFANTPSGPFLYEDAHPDVIKAKPATSSSTAVATAKLTKPTIVAPKASTSKVAAPKVVGPSAVKKTQVDDDTMKKGQTQRPKKRSAQPSSAMPPAGKQGLTTKEGPTKPAVVADPRYKNLLDRLDAANLLKAQAQADPNLLPKLDPAAIKKKAGLGNVKTFYPSRARPTTAISHAKYRSDEGEFPEVGFGYCLGGRHPNQAYTSSLIANACLSSERNPALLSLDKDYVSWVETRKAKREKEAKLDATLVFRMEYNARPFVPAGGKIGVEERKRRESHMARLLTFEKTQVSSVPLIKKSDSAKTLVGGGRVSPKGSIKSVRFA